MNEQLTTLKRCLKNKNIIDSLVFCSIVVCLILSVYQGYFKSSLWNYSNLMIDYSYGILPRGILGAIGSLIFGEYWGKSIVLDVVTQGMALFFFVYLIYKFYKLFYKEKSFIFAIIMLLFSTSVYPKIYMVTNGYYEQFCVPFVIALIEMSTRYSWKKVLRASALFCFITVLISESNAFIVCPVLASIAVLKFVQERQEKFLIDFKMFVSNCLFFVPTLVVCIWSITFKMSDEILAKWVEKISSSNIDFEYQYIVLQFFQNRGGDYLGQSIWSYDRLFIIFPLLIVVLVSWCLIVNKKMFLGIAYAIFGVLCSFIALAEIWFGWDIYRWVLWALVSVLFLSIYIFSTEKELQMPKYTKGIIFVFVCIWILVSFDVSLTAINGWSTNQFRNVTEIYNILQLRG